MALFEAFARLGELTWLDGFCGGGGSSVGIGYVPGQRIVIAINHWQFAIDIHQANHDGTDHDCADMSQVDPWRYPRTDCAWFSPSCTKHSVAQGKKRPVQPDDAAERSRATMWDVQRFAEVHRYRFIIVENVVEVRQWWAFRAWKIAMEDTGYCLHEVFLNAAHANMLGPSANQWRDRWFCMLHLKGTRCPDIDGWLAPMAQCENCGDVRGRQAWKNGRDAGKYRAQYMYACRTCGAVVRPYVRPASELIDWDREAQLIGDRPTPLADKTMWRIGYGLRKYWGSPSLVPVEGRDGKRPTAAGAPMRTVTTRNETGLLVPAGGTWNNDAVPVDRPARTVMTRETTGLVVPPFIAELRGGSSKARLVSEPLSTVTASGNHHGLVIPYYSKTRPRTAEEPFMTVTTVDRAGLMPDPPVPYGVPLMDYLGTLHRRKSRAWQMLVDSCGFRMLEPFEYARFQAFPDSYDWSPASLARPLSKRRRVRMIGNAVPPNLARDLVGCAVESMAL
ncbi:DNA methyltransferase [Streptomyces venezuelae]|uniref:DNA (cytosine-5-)-methyltransferase n=2 Tax=Streptomyces venezuelae TaxID=54571 RepID=A0A5P2CTX5_STRVZ|nr:DNA methyltransferase [Streptomyces venezuelae]